MRLDAIAAGLRREGESAASGSAIVLGSAANLPAGVGDHDQRGQGCCGVGSKKAEMLPDSGLMGLILRSSPPSILKAGTI